MITRERIRYFLMLAVVLICASLVVVVLFYQRTDEPAQELKDIVMQSDVTLHELNYTETEDGVARWNLVADSADHDVNKEMTVIENVRLKLFDQDEAGDVELTAKTGTIDSAMSKVHASGDVVITTQNGYRFTSNSVDFVGKSSKDGQISTADAVKITSENFVITGVGLAGDLGNGRFVLKKNVTAIYYPQPFNGGQ
ncbi:MAG: LPS export ABC transporter periplasmic protein LptC [Desulfuromonas sp.]|nr:LPS export ABC transporter periplasmic protein LptC [Desulfuromonas sp.]